MEMATAAKELELRGKRNAHVLIAAGLPIGRLGAEKQGFIDYLKREREVSFRFEKEQ